MSFFRLKKWYFDVCFNDGDVLFFYFIRFWIGSFDFGLVSVFVSRSAGERLHTIEFHASRIEESAARLQIGNSSLRRENGNVAVEILQRNLSLKLNYLAPEAQWIPGGDGILIDRSKKFTSWIVPIPTAVVRGEIITAIDEISVHGTGYQDLVELTIPPWRLRVSKLWWGRAHFEDTTVVFTKLDFKEDVPSRIYVLIRANQENRINWPGTTGIIHYPFSDDSFELRMSLDDGQSVLTGENSTLKLDHLRVIEEGPIVATTQIRPRFVRNVLEKVSGSLYQTRFTSTATLEMDDVSKTGTAIHELVTWN